MDPFKEMSEMLKLLGDKTRLEMLALLKEQELCVCEIVEIIGMSQPGISQHLRKLKAAGIVNEERRGQWIFYSLNANLKPYINEVLKFTPSVKNKIDELTEKGLKIICN